MKDLSELVRELDTLERIHADIAAVTKREDDRRRYDLVELRRQLSAQIARVGQIAEPLFTRTGDEELAQLYRAKFSKMRSMVAMHQANWPAVLLGERPEEFRASALPMRDANRDFLGWMREMLPAISRSS